MTKERLYNAVIQCMNTDCNAKLHMAIAMDGRYYTFKCKFCGRKQVRFLGFSDLYTTMNSRNITRFSVLKKSYMESQLKQSEVKDE